VTAEVERQNAEMQRKHEEKYNPPPQRFDVHREVITGMRADGPFYSKVMPIDERAYKFDSKIAMQSGPGVVQIEVGSSPDGPWYPVGPGDNAAVKAGAEGAPSWRWRRFLRWRVEPLTRKEFSCAVEVSFEYDSFTDTSKHKPRYNPTVKAFDYEVVTQ